MTKTQTSNKPGLEVYAVEKRGDGQSAQSYWHKIGACWPHKDGNGYSLKLEYLPINGAELVIRKPKPRTETQTTEGGAQ